MTDKTNQQTPDERSRLSRAVNDRLPQKLGRFEIRALLGKGTYGVVYLAFDPDLDREVALKVPHEVAAASHDVVLREARAVARLSHPNVCPVYDVGISDGIPYIVSRYVRGGNLNDALSKSKGGLNPYVALAIVRKIARGVASAHSQGLVHRDLKPGNILHDEVKDDYLITDFGLARLFVQGAQSSGGVSGTPAYMSPEQFGDGEKANDIGPSADVYALGVILYELITGTRPFVVNTPLALMRAHLDSPVEPPSQRRPVIGTQFDSIILKALAKDPVCRYATAAEFEEALSNPARDLAPRVQARLRDLCEADAAERQRRLQEEARSTIMVVAPEESLIRRTPGVVGGDACVRDTRIAVWMLVEAQRLGRSDTDLLDDYPGLTVDDLRAAWQYAAAHRTEIEEAIRANEAA